MPESPLAVSEVLFSAEAGPTPGASHSMGLGRALRIHVSSKFQGNAENHWVKSSDTSEVAKRVLTPSKY